MPDLPMGTVTFLFTDIEGSTRLLQHLGERYSAVLEEHHHLLRAAFQPAGGHEINSQGDSFFVAFSRATDAIAAAVAAQRALAAYPWPEGAAVRVRMGLHTGEPALTPGGYVGLDVHRAARISAAGHGGQVLLSQTTRDLVEQELPEGLSIGELGSHHLKDLQRPEPLFQLVIAGLPCQFPPVRSLDLRPHNLPAQPTPLIGREWEMAAVQELLQRQAVHLVTLTGPGGTGKTRLGLQVAAELLDSFADGVFFIPLAPISDPTLAASTIAQSLGVQETGGQRLRESLKAHLGDKQMLLLIDNFEQVMGAATLVAELLAAAPHIRVLVTSRAPLHLQGEQEFPVPPLALPDRQRLPSLEALPQYAALALFIQRSQAVRPGFAVTNKNAPAVVEICHRLDGLPLAIELAAARLKQLPPHALLGRLSSRLKLLVGGARDLPARQQTLRNTIAWSHDQLDAGEKALFRRLSVFTGDFTLEAAEAVCHGEGDLDTDLLDVVAALVDKSLLRQREQADGEPRFFMLETIREFGLECLATSGEGETIRRRHAQFILALAEAVAAALRGPQQAMGLDRLETEHDNLLAAMAWSMETGEAEVGLRLGAALSGFWYVRAYWTLGRDRLASLLALPEAAAPTPARAKALACTGLLALLQNDYAAASRLLEESVTIWRELGDSGGMAAPLDYLGMMARDRGDYESARRFFEESLAAWREAGDQWGIAMALNDLGEVARRQGDLAAARPLIEEGLAIRRGRGERRGVAFSLHSLAHVARYQGDLAAARSLYEGGLAIWRELGDKEQIAKSLTSLGSVARIQGEIGPARVLLTESLSLFQELRDERGIAECLEALADVAIGSSAGEAVTQYPQEAGTQGGPSPLPAPLLPRAALERAAWLLGAAAALRETMDARLSPVERADYERSVAAVRAALGEAAFAAAWAAGRAMPLEQAVADALQGATDA